MNCKNYVKYSWYTSHSDSLVQSHRTRGRYTCGDPPSRFRSHGTLKWNLEESQIPDPKPQIPGSGIVYAGPEQIQACHRYVKYKMNIQNQSFSAIWRPQREYQLHHDGQLRRNNSIILFPVTTVKIDTLLHNCMSFKFVYLKVYAVS